MSSSLSRFIDSRKATSRSKLPYRPSLDELESRLVPASTISWNGGNWFLYGVNYPWQQYAADFGSGGWGHLANPNQVKADMATLGNEGDHFLRWWVFGDGRYDPLFDSTGHVTGLDSQFFSDLDTELQYAANNHIYLDLTLLDTSIMNTPQFFGSVQTGGHGNIMTDPTVQQSYLDNALKPLLQHIAASPYKNYVLAYDIINEPEGDLKPLAWPLNFWGNGGAPVDGSFVQTFVKNCASYIHTYGGGALATVGSAEPQFVSYWKGLGLDFYCVHYYPWMDFGNAAGSGLPTYASLNLDKPCIVEEYPTADSSYGANDTAPLSAKWYLDDILNQGYAGSLGWSFNAGDSASNWSSFQPVFTAWGQAHSSIVGPQAVAASAPVITANPSNQTATAGQGTGFTAAATGSPTPTVQWQASTNGGSTWTNISGATSTTYTFTTSTSQSGSQYRAVFTNSAGSATTSAATLTVNPAVTAPSITTQPARQTVNAGQSVSFSVTATGTAPLTYQWQKLSGSTWGNVGMNSASFTISAAASSDAGSYHVVVANSAGSVTSSTGTLTVNVSPLVTSNPTSQTVTAGRSVSFSAAASGSPPPSVQWQVSTNSGSTFTNISGATATTYTFTAAATQTGNQFRAVFTNSAGSATTSAAKLTVTAPATGSIAIDAGGGAIGSFVADIDASGGAVRSTADTIVTSGVTNAAPMAVYQSQRYGNFTYTLPGLTPNAVYTVRLHFAEFIQNGAGKRTFSVAINGTTVLSNFDVYATAGGFEKALVEQFNAKADAGGKITIVFTNGNNNSIVSGIEVAAAKSVLINTGGTATGSFQADGFFSGGTTSSTTATIDTSLVTNPAPPPVYQTERYGTFTYTITGLTPGASYTVRLDFAEIYWTQVGQRVFNVAINGTQVLTNFDIIAAAGGPNRAIARTFTATADSSGDITIAFTSVVNYAKISGIEIVPQ
jgi:hypothetical protein